MKFRTIKDFPNYAVSDTGVIVNLKTMRIKKCPVSGDGYATVSLWKNNVETRYNVHRLVAETWIPRPEDPEKKVVDHINRIKTDNRVENLRWVTYSENNMNTVDGHGPQSKPIRMIRYREVNDKYGTHKSFEEVIETRDFEMISDCAEYLDCSPANITLMVRAGTIGRRGKMRGLKFELIEKKV